ncbi:MAG: hypothetical protein ACXVLQ_02870 [Bacteriovorax sp.]
MDKFNDDINREFLRIKEKIENGSSLNEEDLKVILLSVLNEEDVHESKQ